MLDEIAGTLNMFGALRSDRALGSRPLQRLKALAPHTDPAPSPASTIANPTAAAPSSVNSDCGQNTRHFRNPLAAGIATLMAWESRGAAAIDRAYAAAIRALHSGLELDHTLLFRRTDASTRYFAWLGEGDFYALVKGEELLDVAVRDVVRICFMREEDVLIRNPGDPKIQAFIPDWLRSAAGTQPLVLLPVRDEHGTVTVFCGLRGAANPFAFTAHQSQQLRALRQRLSGFEVRQHAGAQTAGAPPVVSMRPS